MTKIGVPKSEVTARDHIQVRAALVKRLGGANEAVVFGRIYYRADPESRSAEEHAGEWWWVATYPQIEQQTGLSYKKVRLAIAALVDLGAIEQQPAGGKSYRYRPIIAEESRLPSGADSGAEDSAPEGTKIRPRGQKDVPSGAVTPLIDKEDVRDTPVVPDREVVDAGFERVFSAWPATRRVRKTATVSWAKAVKTVGPDKVAKLVEVAEQFGIRYRSWATSEQTFVPHLTTWLNQERWTTPLPEANRGAARSTVEHGRSVDQILRDREALEQRAVSA